MVNGFDPDIDVQQQGQITDLIERLIAQQPGLDPLGKALLNTALDAARSGIEQPLLDAFGLPITDADGNPVTVTVQDPQDFLRIFDRVVQETAASGGLSANVAAQIAQQDRTLQESRRQFDIGEERASEEFEVTERRRNQENQFDATLDLLEQRIRVGEIRSRDADRLLDAAIQRSNVERSLLTELAPFSVPEGAEFVPNLEPGGAIGAVAAALGFPFGGISTGGGLTIDPSQITSGVTAGSPVAPTLDPALAAAMAALAGPSVPPPSLSGTSASAPSQGINAASRALAGI